jgi:hypothetical protein
MSTPNMTGRGSDAADDGRETYTPADLLDDGEVNITKVKEITTPANCGGVATDKLTAADCGDIRDRLADENVTADALAGADGDYGIAPTTLRKHARGDCWHTHDTPPVTWSVGAGWHREEGEDV